MLFRDLQRRAVDSIKQHALKIATGSGSGSRRAEAVILTEYLWAEQGAEATALERIGVEAPPWLVRLVSNQLADERRHAELLRERLAQLGAKDRTPPALSRAKLWWIERACESYKNAFAAGPIVVVLAVAAQLEGTGVRVLARHLGVLEARDPDAPTAIVLRSILADERRHAKSCAAAAARLVRDDERAVFGELRERIATIDRAFGVTLALGYWLVLAGCVLRDRTRNQAGPARPQGPTCRPQAWELQ